MKMKPSFNKDNKDKYKNIQKKQTAKSVKRQKIPKKNNPSQKNPISENKENKVGNQIISGYFVEEKPYKELIIARVNTFLYTVLGVLVAFCAVCYYFVSCREVRLNQISRATLELNYENDELQNKIDMLQSYYNIDKAVSKTNILERAKQVVEVSAADTPHINLKSNNKNKHAFVVTY